MIHPGRVRCLNKIQQTPGPVLYWMSRDQRVADNWALLFAQQLANERKVPIIVLFCLAPAYLGAKAQHFEFLLQGLEGVESDLRTKQIPFYLRCGQPGETLSKFATEKKIGAIVCDFSPLRLNRKWKEDVARSIRIPIYEVDAHNIVPCWIASNKMEYAARTMRPKIHRLLGEYLHSFPALKKHAFIQNFPAPVDWNRVRSTIQAKRLQGNSRYPDSGERYARRTLREFLRKRLGEYGKKRNDPSTLGQSNLSPYLHYGQISAQRVALEIRKAKQGLQSKETFLEELVVRRELSDNFCYYNPSYDTFHGFPEWAQKTLNKHRSDSRPYLYQKIDFENANTHDDLWNAAQMEMVKTGKMHGYLRMYWAKKILEWSPSPEEALETAIELNDSYELDGRDPNGYTGIAWSIGGVHDRPWFERPVFGTVRYMSYNGCKSKFDVKKYIRQVNELD